MENKEGSLVAKKNTGRRPSSRAYKSGEIVGGIGGTFAGSGVNLERTVVESIEVTGSGGIVLHKRLTTADGRVFRAVTDPRGQPVFVDPRDPEGLL